mmetsp:Transcript_35707/g.83587  ORF Transcript_35707/g.83587 Transcript_35707/m.83587 type:complete len:385 (+) Transcript_35707:121-1275(+)
MAEPRACQAATQSDVLDQVRSALSFGLASGLLFDAMRSVGGEGRSVEAAMMAVDGSDPSPEEEPLNCLPLGEHLDDAIAKGVLDTIIGVSMPSVSTPATVSNTPEPTRSMEEPPPLVTGLEKLGIEDRIPARIEEQMELLRSGEGRKPIEPPVSLAATGELPMAPDGEPPHLIVDAEEEQLVRQPSMENLRHRLQNRLSDAVQTGKLESIFQAAFVPEDSGNVVNGLPEQVSSKTGETSKGNKFMEALSQRDRLIGQLHQQIQEAQRKVDERQMQCATMEANLSAVRSGLAHIGLDLEWHQNALTVASQRKSELESGQKKLVTELHSSLLLQKHAGIDAEKYPLAGGVNRASLWSGGPVVIDRPSGTASWPRPSYWKKTQQLPQ